MAVATLLGLSAVDDVAVLFQRSLDIPQKVEEGSADLAIVGLDRWLESRVEGGDSIIIGEDLGFGRCELVVAVPDTWIDITSIADLAELALEFHERGKEIQVATKYPRTTQRFFLGRSINYFEIVPASGATEAAPAMGYADIIVEMMTSGATLKENRLKPVEGGNIVRSQACLIGNRRLLKEEPAKLVGAKKISELIEARLRAHGYYSVTANLPGASPEEAAFLVLAKPPLAGLQGPSVSQVFSKHGDQGWCAITVVVPLAELIPTIEHLREVGGSGMTVVAAQYIFEGQSELYARLVAQLADGRAG